MPRHLYRCPLRWSDMDVYGVVNNVMFLRYLEEARVDLMHRMEALQGDAFFKDGSVVVAHEIRYLRRLTHRHEPVDIDVWVSRLESATVTTDYEVRDGKTLYARASTVMAPFDYRRGRPRRITPQEEAFFEKYLEQGRGR
jgi:acyl-CoA thioester hydrolase